MPSAVLRRGSVLLLLGILALAFVASPVVAAPPVFAYLTHNEKLYGYRLADDGSLKPTAQIALKGYYADLIAVHPSGKLLYIAERFSVSSDGYGPDEKPVAKRKSTEIRIYRIGDDGALREVHRYRVPYLLISLTFSPDGKRLYCPIPQNAVIMFPIDSAGKPGRPLANPVPATLPLLDAPIGYNRYQFQIAPDGKTAFSWRVDGFTDHVSHDVVRFQILPNGGLKKTGEWNSSSSRFDSGPNSITNDCGELFFYPTGGRVLMVGMSGANYLYRLDSVGKLKRTGEVARDPFVKIIGFHPTNDFVFVQSGEREEASLQVVKIAESGAVKTFSRLPLDRGTSDDRTDTAYVDPAGRFLFVVHTQDFPYNALEPDREPIHTLTTYRITDDGRLTSIAAKKPLGVSFASIVFAVAKNSPPAKKP